MSNPDGKPNITFTRTSSDVNDKESDSLILEVDVNDGCFLGLYFQDESWKIMVSTLESNVIHLEWNDFLK